MFAASTAYRPAPTLSGQKARRYRGPTPETLVDTYMAQHHSPRYSGAGRRPPPSMPGAPMDPESWWRLYVLSTHVRGAATLQQSVRKEAWADSLRSSPRQEVRSPPGSPRSSGSLSPRTRAVRPAPSLPSQRTARQAMQMASSYPPFKATVPGDSPRALVRHRDVGVQAAIAGEGIQARRAAPALPRATASAEELRQAQRQIVDKITTRFSTLRRAFRTWDADASGSITKEEFIFGLEVLNLNNIRKEVIDTLFNLIDFDSSGNFDFGEFTRVLTSEDVMNMNGPKVQVDNRGQQMRRELEAKRAAQERIAANVGLTVDEYCEYYGLKEIPL